MKTGSHLRIEQFGTKAMGVELLGDPSQPEPEHFRVIFPGGEVDITRCDDGSHWVHVRRNMPTDTEVVTGDRRPGVVLDGRQDVTDKHASECHAGELDNPQLEHLAVRIGVDR